MGDARDVYEEGALIFPAVAGPARLPGHRATSSACARCASACPSSGGATTWRCSARPGSASASCWRSAARSAGTRSHAHAEDWFDYSERRMVAGDPPAAERRARSSAPATTRSRACPTASRSRSRVEVDAEDGRIEVDLRDNPDCQPCGLNLTEACALGAAMIGVFNSIADHTVPPNAGSFRRVEVQLRENCVVGIAAPPASAARSPRPTSPTASRARCSARSPSSPTASAWPRAAPSSRRPAA